VEQRTDRRHRSRHVANCIHVASFCRSSSDRDGVAELPAASHRVLQAALHCCNGHSKINRKMEMSILCRIATPQNFILKFGTRDFVRNITPCANLGADRFCGGFSPNTCKFETFLTFHTVLTFSRSSPRVKPRHWRTCLIAQTSKYVPFGGQNDGWRHLGGNVPLKQNGHE